MVRQLVVRLAAAVALGLVGWPLGLLVGDLAGDGGFLPWGLVFILSGTTLGALLAPYMLLAPARWSFLRIQEISLAPLIMGVVGLLVGLVVAALLSVSLGRVPGTLGWVLPIAVSLLLGALGASVLGVRGELLARRVPALRQAVSRGGATARVILLDTSAIIDGRVAEVAETGFMPGPLGVPRFILDELRHVADSRDTMRRNRGRRGLEVLNRLRQSAATPVQLLDGDGRDQAEADARLVAMAREMGAYILTTDYNLNRVAAIQGVRVLNVNELANAIKSVVLPGEEMSVQVIQEGKEAGQGVAFLDDGTMVVVEDGRRYLNSRLEVTVSRVLQTAAGRIIFAQPKSAA